MLGMPHEVFVDGVFAYVQPKPGVELTPGEILEYCKNMAAYKRPIHVELWPVDEPLPATRVGKVNVPALIELAEKVVARLRSEGKWDK